MSDHDIERCIKAYVAMRDDLTEKEREFNDWKKERKAKMQEIADYLAKRAAEQGVESFRTQYGTGFKTTTDSVKARDWDRFIEYVIENDERQLLNKSPNKTGVKEYMEAHGGNLPPGIDYEQHVEFQIRRA